MSPAVVAVSGGDGDIVEVDEMLDGRRPSQSIDHENDQDDEKHERQNDAQPMQDEVQQPVERAHQNGDHRAGKAPSAALWTKRWCGRR